MNKQVNSLRKNGIKTSEIDRLPAVALNDPFRPEDSTAMAICICCGQKFPLNEVVWVENAGLWCCPYAGCNGAGVGFDIHILQPGQRANTNCPEHAGGQDIG